MAVINYKAVRRSLKSLRSQVGSAMVGFIQAGTGALKRDSQAKMREVVSVTDYAANGVSGDRVDPTGATDSILGIQAAIDYVASLGGGDVLFPYTDDYYKITSAIRLKDNVTLRGVGGRPKIKNTGTGTSRDDAACVVNDGFFDTGNSNIHIHNLTLQNRYQDFLTPVADSGETIGLRYGVFFAGVTQASIVNCYVLNTCAEGIYMGGVDAARDLCSDIVVHGNTVENCFASGIAVTNGQRIRISDNVVLNTTIFGIDVEPNTGMVGKDITISGNVIDGVRADYYKNSTGYGQSNALGISLTTGSLPNQVANVSVTGNTVRDVQRYTTSGLSDFGLIVASGVLSSSIVGNTCTDSESSGIVVRSSSQSLTVTGNTVENVYNYGIGVSGSTDVSVTGNTVEDCSARGIQATASAARVAITGNTVRDSVTAGIYVQSVSDIAISGNTVADTRSGGDRLMTYGVHISSSCTNIMAVGNVVSNTTSDAVRNVDSPTNSVVFNIEDTAWRLRGTNFHLYSDGNIYQMGHATLTAKASAGLSNNTLFLDSADNILKFKDSGGTLRSLW